jgi:DNA-directed RNA polymerase subunit RPC12/RpoP
MTSAEIFYKFKISINEVQRRFTEIEMNNPKSILDLDVIRKLNENNAAKDEPETDNIFVDPPALKEEDTNPPGAIKKFQFVAKKVHLAKKTFQSSDNLDDLKEKCEKCGKLFFDLAYHMLKAHRKEYRCAKCDFKSFIREDVTDHYSSVHAKKKEFLTIPEFDDFLEVDLKIERLEEEPEDQQEEEEEWNPEDESEDDEFCCSKCDFIADTEKKLQRHKNREHDEKNEKNEKKEVKVPEEES